MEARRETCIRRGLDIHSIMLTDWKQIFENYGNGITPHMMRHYYASVMNQNGNLAFVQQQLGHSSVNTTVNNYANGAVGMKEKLMEM